MITVEYEVENNKPILYVWTRDKDGNKTQKRVDNFEPYFYVLENETIPLHGIKEMKKGFVDIFGNKLVKLTVNLPKDVTQLRTQFLKSFESDILFPIRYIINSYDEIPKTLIKVCFLDIEVRVENNKFPQPELAEENVISITCYDSLSEKLYVFVWRKDLKNNKIEKSLKKNIYYFDNEIDMLRCFNRYIKSSDPDILTGYNVIDFDLQYLINRMKKLNINYKVLSPLGKVFCTKKKRVDILIKGREVFDLLSAYRKINFARLEGNRLVDVAEREKLPIQKLKVKDITQLWKDNIEMFLEYNITDVLVCVELDKKLNLISYYDEIHRMSHCPFSDTLMNSKVIDCYVLSFCKNKVILPNKPHGEYTGSIKGAFVLDPRRGIHENVIGMDLKSLYPSTIVSCNISPDTLDPNGDININGIKFNSKKEGILPSVIKQLFELREKYKNEMKQYEKGSEMYEVYYRKQYAVKVILNSIYGVMSYERSRFYSKDMGESVTYVGREIIKWTKNIIEQQGFEVIAGDTDSVFIKSKEKELNFIIEEAKRIQQLCNKSYDQFKNKFNIQNHIWFLQFEKIAKRIIITGKKKRYALWNIYQDGKEVDSIDVVGFEEKRSDNPRIMRTIQKNVFTILLKENDKDKLFEYLKSEIKKIYNGEYDKESIGVPSQIEKNLDEYTTNLPKVRGCKFSTQYLKIHFEKGQKPKALYVKHPQTDVVCFFVNDEVKDFEPDYDYIIMHILKKKIDRILDVVGWNFNYNVKQKTLLEDF